MKSYDKIEDYLEDKSFKDWVLKADPNQEAFWQNWQINHPDKKEVLMQAKTILLETDFLGQDWGEQRKALLFSKIKKRISIGDNDTYAPYVSGISKVEKWTRMALLVLFAGFSLSAFLIGSFQGDGDLETVAVEEYVEEWVVKYNPKGQKSAIHLPDGSTIILNAESEIRFLSNFGQGQRDLYLKGESFFEVAPDSVVPFRVFSGELVTVALGTSFNINSFKTGRERIQLASGKVKVFQEKKQNQSIYLLPGEEVVMEANKPINKRKFDLSQAFLWKEGIIQFEQTPVAESIDILERWYGVEFILENKNDREILISGRFEKTNLNDVLESLGYAYGFDYKINNKDVIINFKPIDQL